MNEAALRYSPEMALAFQPTDTDRPATKKSCAVFDRFAAQKPIQMVAMTVRALKVRIQGSMFIVWKGGKGEWGKGAFRCGCFGEPEAKLRDCSASSRVFP